MGSSDFITPPPGLIPQHDTGTQKVPRRVPHERPQFRPAVPGTLPAAPPGASRDDREAPPTAPTPTAPAGVAQQQGAAQQFRLVFTDGTAVPLAKALVVGRNPTAPPSEPHADAFRIVDRSVSKTHALVQPTAGALLVTDLHSTNGVLVRDSTGSETTLKPGAPHAVLAGTTLVMGDVELAVAAD